MKQDNNFIAIDFETATSRRASICEVGIRVVRGGKICGLLPNDSTAAPTLKAKKKTTLHSLREVLSDSHKTDEEAKDEYLTEKYAL